MGLRATRVAGWLIAPLLSIAGLAAASDLRVVEAAKNRDAKTVRALLQQRADVNAPQPDGATALHWAAHWDEIEIADLLLRAGARVNATNDYGVVPLLLACDNGSAAMVERLLKAGANPNAALASGQTALMTAARAGKVDAVKALLAGGADLNAKEPSLGQTALMWAVGERHADVARFLLEGGADVHAPSKSGFTPLLFAARAGDLETTRVLLAAGASVNEAAKNGITPLMIATIRAHTAYATFLLEQGANPNAGPGFTPLHWASGEWDSGLTNADQGIKANDTEWSALGGLRGPAKLELVQVLLAHGADPNARATSNPSPGNLGRGGNLTGGTPFLMAARACDVGVMRALVAKGADPRLTTKRKSTPLMVAAGLLGMEPGESWATSADCLAAVKLLFELGADVTAVDDIGETALHGAAYLQRDDVVQFLVDKGAKLNVANNNHWTPLTIAEGVYQAVPPNYFSSPSTAALLRKLGAEPTPPGVERDETIAYMAGRLPGR